MQIDQSKTEILRIWELQRSICKIGKNDSTDDNQFGGHKLVCVNLSANWMFSKNSKLFKEIVRLVYGSEPLYAIF